MMNVNLTRKLVGLTVAVFLLAPAAAAAAPHKVQMVDPAGDATALAALVASGSTDDLSQIDAALDLLKTFIAGESSDSVFVAFEARDLQGDTRLALAGPTSPSIGGALQPSAVWSNDKMAARNDYTAHFTVKARTYEVIAHLARIDVAPGAAPPASAGMLIDLATAANALATAQHAAGIPPTQSGGARYDSAGPIELPTVDPASLLAHALDQAAQAIAQAKTLVSPQAINQELTSRRAALIQSLDDASAAIAAAQHDAGQAANGVQASAGAGGSGAQSQAGDAALTAQQRAQYSIDQARAALDAAIATVTPILNDVVAHVAQTLVLIDSYINTAKAAVQALRARGQAAVANPPSVPSAAELDAQIHDAFDRARTQADALARTIVPSEVPDGFQALGDAMDGLQAAIEDALSMVDHAPDDAPGTIDHAYTQAMDGVFEALAQATSTVAAIQGMLDPNALAGQIDDLDAAITKVRGDLADRQQWADDESKILLTRLTDTAAALVEEATKLKDNAIEDGGILLQQTEAEALRDLAWAQTYVDVAAATLTMVTDAVNEIVQGQTVPDPEGAWEQLLTDLGAAVAKAGAIVDSLKNGAPDQPWIERQAADATPVALGIAASALALARTAAGDADGVTAGVLAFTMVAYRAVELACHQSGNDPTVCGLGASLQTLVGTLPTATGLLGLTEGILASPRLTPPTVGVKRGHLSFGGPASFAALDSKQLADLAGVQSQVANALSKLPASAGKPDLKPEPFDPSMAPTPASPVALLYSSFELVDGANVIALDGAVDVEADTITVRVPLPLIGAPREGDLLKEFWAASQKNGVYADFAPDAVSASPDASTQPQFVKPQFGENYAFAGTAASVDGKTVAPGDLVLTIMEPKERTIEPGGVASYAMTLENKGKSPRAGFMTVSASDLGWTAQVGESAWTLAPGEKKVFTASVSGLQGGAHATATRIAVSPEGGATQYAEYHTTMVAKSHVAKHGAPGLEILGILAALGVAVIVGRRR